LVFAQKAQKKFIAEDISEWEKNRHLEEPCRDAKLTITKNMPLFKKLEIAKNGSRGIGSDIAETRQVAWSQRKVNKVVFVKDDGLQKRTVATTNQV
jgi:hypothetical protein